MVVDESRLRFDFDERYWDDVLKYDESTDYAKVERAIKTTKAVDIIGILKKRTLVLMEIKNFKQHQIENKHRIEQGELIIEIAQKVRDSVAGIVGAARNSTNDSALFQQYSQLFLDAKKEMHIVLWLEQDELSIAHTSKRQKVRGSVLNNQLKKKMKWLSPKVFTANRMNNPYADSLSVSLQEE